LCRRAAAVASASVGWAASAVTSDTNGR
jgi:hypothetical protein